MLLWFYAEHKIFIVETIYAKKSSFDGIPGLPTHGNLLQ